MKYLFFVQSEGRGHLTQALTVASKLRAEGHEVAGVIMNNNPYRQIPDFFKTGIACPIHFLNSTRFINNKKNTGIDLPKSILFNIVRIPKYLKSLKSVHNIKKELNPDAIINFYEPLAGLYYFFFRPKINSYCLGHQFFLEHPYFKKPKGKSFQHWFLISYNKLVAYGTKYNIALSFVEEVDIPKKRMVVCPPLIREEIKSLNPENHNFILSYLLNDGYCQEIINYAKEYPNQKIEAFWDRKNAAPESKFGDNLIFHPISGQLFLDFLKNCSGYAATAGFESICEAAYLQKDILMIPTANHYEQLCNAVDAKRAGLADYADYFNINFFLEKKDSSVEAKLSFKKWVDNNSQKIIKIFTENN